MSFVHLSVHSEYSLHDSLIGVGDLMEKVKEHGMPAVAVTDDTNLFAAIKHFKGGTGAGVKPILGAQVRLPSTSLQGSLMTVLCKDNEGYRALTEIISRGYREGVRGVEGSPRIPLEWFEGYGQHLIALSGGREGDIGRYLLGGRVNEARQLLDSCKAIFGDNYYLELQRIGQPMDDRYVTAAVDLAIDTDTLVVATNPARFLESKDFSSHEVRVAIAQKRTVRDVRDDRIAPCTVHQYLKSAEEMAELFSDIPEALENTLRIAAQCNVEITLGKSVLPRFPAPDGMSEAEYLEKISREGLEARLKSYFKTPEAIAEVRTEYEDRLAFELGVINKMGFPGYFLIVADFIQWAKRNDIPVGPGRGSGAGSLVAYSCGITDLNPIPYSLLFERFLNPERVSMPDFDIDFCMDRRDEVIEYVAQTYGRESVSQIVTFGTMAARSVVRDACRALSFPYPVGDAIAREIPEGPDVSLADSIAGSATLQLMLAQKLEGWEILAHALALEGRARQTGKHAGGVVIADTKLTDYTATMRDVDGTGLVSQFDKDDVEAAGLVKFDFLGLRNLTIIHQAVKTINRDLKAKGLPELNIDDIPLDDKPTYDLIQRCETTAVFQLESAGMKKLIKAMRPDCIEDLIALVALFRPGPLQSGMVEDFIDRKHGRQEISYPHPSYQYEGLEPALKPTYGIILYQEQVMQIAQVMSGYTLGGADMLRRAMGKKKPEEMALQRGSFVEGAVKNGHTEHLAGQIFDLVEKFAGYGFNKSHSAAYALVAYQTAYLKAHYPAAFMAAVLSSDMDKTEKVVRFVHETRMMGLEVLPPSANHSNWEFTSQQGKVYYGLGAIKGFGENAARAYLAERDARGTYKDLEDFMFRNNLMKSTAKNCIDAGMLDFTGISRVELREVSDAAVAAGKQVRKSQHQGSLFDMEIPMARIEVDPEVEEWTRLQGERRVLGMCLTGHPYDRYRDKTLGALSGTLAQVMDNLTDKSIEDKDRLRSVSLAGLMTEVEVKLDSRGNWAIFKLDDGTDRITCKIFAKNYHELQSFIADDNLVFIKAYAKVDPKEGYVNFLVNEVQLLDNYLENQKGQVVIKLPEGANFFREMAKIHGLDKLNDEGAIRVYMQVGQGGELQELPIPPISANGPAMKELKKFWGADVHVEFIKQTKTRSYNRSADVQTAADVADPVAERARIRMELEKELLAAKEVMAASKERQETAPAP
ncbi:DNA polymerase-3 subunit alpha [Pseudomonas nitritireducens]|uniref:DNA polymerase III subunit alpha n=1 Tax=Pseudomonas nitroreducens TaxID=46680 RepID=A0A7W7KF38_PSENT|nr:DNA polymerase III subunit alpha [Pseudomonas nitritireducens]MBB4861360.1 DNA polymerase-3 subunit alpha [Pseudomonas nitritireducens]